jgi:hypothetical protein
MQASGPLPRVPFPVTRRRCRNPLKSSVSAHASRAKLRRSGTVSNNHAPAAEQQCAANRELAHRATSPDRHRIVRLDLAKIGRHERVTGNFVADRRRLRAMSLGGKNSTANRLAAVERAPALMSPSACTMPRPTSRWFFPRAVLHLNLRNERARRRDHGCQTSQPKEIRRPDASFGRPAQGPVSSGIRPDGAGPVGDLDPTGCAGDRDGLVWWTFLDRGRVDLSPVAVVPWVLLLER